jgi:hypothetical protein
MPLQQMSTDERLAADYAGTGLTIGKHPMEYRRRKLRMQHVLSAEELRSRKDGEFVRTAGCVIARQRPGTEVAKRTWLAPGSVPTNALPGSNSDLSPSTTIRPSTERVFVVQMERSCKSLSQ